MEEKTFADAEFPNSPDGPLTVCLRKEAIVTEQGFTTTPSTYPVTICPARYSGAYEGGSWLCFPVDAEMLGKDSWQEWRGSDIECAEWWAEAEREGWPIGRGASPDLAYQDLIERSAEKAGIKLEEWSAEPTWELDELRRRDGDPG